MTKLVLDASAVMAVLRGEPGSEHVVPHLSGSLVSCINLAEVYCLARARGSAPDVDAAAIRQMQLVQVPFDEAQAQIVASLHGNILGKTLGLADRACLALGISKGLPVITGNRDWLKLDLGVEVRLLRNASTAA